MPNDNVFEKRGRFSCRGGGGEGHKWCGTNAEVNQCKAAVVSRMHLCNAQMRHIPEGLVMQQQSSPHLSTHAAEEATTS